MSRRTSLLGARTDVVSTVVEEGVGWFRTKPVSRELHYLEWTIDGVPLRQVVAWPEGQVASEVTPIQNASADRMYEADYLRAVLGEPVARDWTVMPDGRVPLLVCSADFDLGCRALTAEVAVDGDRVEWRDLAWQCDDEPLDLAGQGMPIITVAFERKQYDDVVRPLLAAAVNA